MVVTVNKPSANGVRPINLGRDLSQVTSLLALVFNRKVEGMPQLWPGYTPYTFFPFLAKLNPMANRLQPGFVWEENGEIVGNATLLGSKKPGRFIVVNVAVHPQYRRRGIARQLMQATMDYVAAQNGHTIMLQVVKDNEAGVRLYQQLNFRQLGSMTSWYSRSSQVPEIEMLHQPQPRIRELPKNQWEAAYQLDVASLAPDLNWPDPIVPHLYRRNLWQWLDGLMSGRQAETWAIHDKQQQLLGMASIYSEWGRHHYITMRVAPSWRGRLERPLLAKISRRLRYLPNRHIRIDHPDDDEVMNGLLREGRFTPRRTLTHMRLDLR